MIKISFYANLFYCLCIVRCLVGNVAYAQTESFSHQIEKVELTPEIHIKKLNNLALQYIDIPKVDSAIDYASQALRLAESEELDSLVASTNYSLGYIYDLDGQLDQALEYYENARVKYEALDIKSEVATCMNSKGVAAYFKGEFDLAIKFYLETLEYVEQHNIKDVMSNALNNLGVIYRITNKNKEAIDIYKRTLELSRNSKNIPMVATSYHNLGVAFSFDSILDQALLNFDSALHYYRVLSDTFEIGRTSVAIGEAQFLAGNSDVARPYLLSGVKYLDVGSGQEELSKTYLLLGRLERDGGNFPLALDYFDKGFALVKETDRKDVIMEFYLEMQSCYERIGKPDRAHQLLKKYVDLYKEIQTSEKLEVIEELQTKYETEEKDKEIALQEVIILKNQRQRNLLIGGIIGLLFLAGFILYALRKRQLYRDIITQSEKEIQSQKIQRLEQEQKIMALDYMLLGEENERKRVAKDLHDSLGALLTSAKLQIQKIHQDISGDKGKSLFGKAEKIIENAAQEVRRISHDMMPDALVNLGLQAAIEDLANSINTSDQLNVSAHFFDLDESKFSDHNKVSVYRILQELCQNVIKHAHASHMIIQLTQEDHKLLLEVEDDGVGFNMEQLEFRKGMGLNNIESRVKYLDGTLHIESKEGGPTIFSFEVPLKTKVITFKS